MIFPTLSFLVFFLLVWPAAWLSAVFGTHQAHKLVIVVASCVFYASWGLDMMLALLGCVAVTWASARTLDRAPTERLKRAMLSLGIGANVATLLSAKYYVWFLEQAGDFFSLLGSGPSLPFLDIVVPVGISFYTLQSISYLVDLKRGEVKDGRSLLDVAFYISFFPHLLAGPIVRASRFLPQLERPPDPDRTFVQLGVMLIVWGVFKKEVIANHLAVNLVDKAFFDPLSFGTVDIAAAIYGYAVQIYCDFSAYSDIAIGLAALLGYRLPRNFRQPYRAATMTDFWRRWHISLSSWLRDYVYIPLGGNRRGHGRTLINVLLTMLIGGLWHGAAWKFVMWGGFHGSLLTIERGLLSTRETPPGAFSRIGGVVVTFHAVCLGWILFRADSLAQAGDVLAQLGDWSRPVRLLTPTVAAMTVLGLVIHYAPSDLLKTFDRVYHRLPTWAVGVMAGSALLIIEAMGGDGSAPFIYYRF